MRFSGLDGKRCGLRPAQTCARRTLWPACLTLVLALWCSAAHAALSWTEQPAPHPTAYADLLSVSCSSSRACMAVGRSLGGPPLAERWNGVRWSMQNTATFAGSRNAWLYGVSCRSRDGCVAVGFTGPWPLVERWDGSRWFMQVIPRADRVRGGELRAVSCVSRRFCMAVGTAWPPPAGAGYAFAERWNGTTWALQRVPGNESPELNGVTCTSDRVCIAVGYGFPKCGVEGPVSERWDGTRWSLQHVPFGCLNATVLRGVACTASTTCLAVGEVQELNGGPYGALWNGKTWSENDSGDPLNAISCRPDFCTGVGHGCCEAYVATDRWNGSTWSSQPNNLSSLSYLRDVSCPSATVCFAVGTHYGRLGHTFPIVARGP